MSPRVVIQVGGLGDGRLECDGKQHFWIVPSYRALGCLEKTPMGICPHPETCLKRADSIAKDLERQAAEEAAKQEKGK